MFDALGQNYRYRLLSEYEAKIAPSPSCFKPSIPLKIFSTRTIPALRQKVDQAVGLMRQIILGCCVIYRTGSGLIPPRHSFSYFRHYWNKLFVVFGFFSVCELQLVELGSDVVMGFPWLLLMPPFAGCSGMLTIPDWPTSPSVSDFCMVIVYKSCPTWASWYRQLFVHWSLLHPNFHRHHCVFPPPLALELALSVVFLYHLHMSFSSKLPKFHGIVSLQLASRFKGIWVGDKLSRVNGGTALVTISQSQ